MATPPIAHFGTTLIEKAPPEGVDQAQVPVDGALADTLDFLRIFGFEPHMQNMYPGMGRQYIWRRGAESDIDYVEKDTFTSYSAQPRPATDAPRVGDTIFRLTHNAPVAVWQQWADKGYVAARDALQERAFVAGQQDWLWFAGPDGQHYELGPTQAHRADNHVVYVWTAADRINEVAKSYEAHFACTRSSQPAGEGDFHGAATITLLRRESPGLTVGLLHGAALAPRWSDDIFVEAGYSHFRLAAPDMQHTKAACREAFPQGGDVAFVYFEDSYLELVQAPAA